MNMAEKKDKECCNSSKKPRGQAECGEEDKIFMQLLRSQRMSCQKIARLVGYSRETVRQYTDKTYFPPGTNINLILVVRQLAMKAALDAWKDKGENAYEHAQSIQKYTDAVLKLENLRDQVSLRDKILSLEWLMKEEDLPEEALEIIQKCYDRLNEELKG